MLAVGARVAKRTWEVAFLQDLQLRQMQQSALCLFARLRRLCRMNLQLALLMRWLVDGAPPAKRKSTLAFVGALMAPTPEVMSFCGLLLKRSDQRFPRSLEVAVTRRPPTLLDAPPEDSRVTGDLVDSRVTGDHVAGMSWRPKQGWGGAAASSAMQDDEEKKEEKKVYQCDVCKKMLFASTSLIDCDVDQVWFDWQGHLPQICMECYEERADAGTTMPEKE